MQKLSKLEIEAQLNALRPILLQKKEELSDLEWRVFSLEMDLKEEDEPEVVEDELD